MIFRQWGIALGALGLSALSGVSAAGVLDKVQAGGALVIAHRESSVPFSYIDTRSGKPVGYALDLCLRLAEAVRKQTGRKDMKVEFLMVTPANRMAVIEQGKADMECGSTTNNAQRRQTVAFTVPHFITGARMLVKAESTINAMEDLKGKKLVSTKGTSPMALVTQANRQRLMGITIVEAPDHARALEMVEKGEADAFVMDDVLLNGLAAARPDPRALKVVGKFLSTEPLAIMLPKADTAFKKLVDEEMKRIITSREIHPIYEKWFLQPIPPSSTNLNLPISYLLRDFWKYPTADILL
ncbi:amino acid ABC transporter substrate-binding protein [Delftia sp. NA_296.1]|uniref:amino acid ABC transporter substrate-binding protein n=1 Tax=Delftia TaxID=80865 RepID=UPI00020E7EF7|nr:MULTISPECIES: amino acid ABC transporter substrate-binding protein [Delftia]AEF89408.1 ABC-type transporter, periplasmic subunit family 3 [Delftia sp. Cs1-4]EZP56012.1 Glutamate/aspartate transport system substrate-binding protein [Delftia sp. RIT313]MBO0988136.1 amino acid ABC transporter substrate-binding protein [Delftia sp. SD083]MBO1036567.1 amino acid ABC transporter substrate-binding protein [Delftia sp. SD018]QPR37763.1 amino acid ABC transporter substrate-binding protein [Delftia a